MSYKAEGFHVGDVVQIRQWDDMAEEFGVDWDGTILVRYKFTKGMKELCGKEAIIKGVYDERIILEFVDKSAKDLARMLNFNTDMIEPYVPPKEKEFTIEITLDSFI